MLEQKLTGSCGAIIFDVDLAHLSNADFDFVLSKLEENGVLYFPDQDLDIDSFRTLGHRFGELEKHKIVDGMEDYPEVIKVHKPSGESASFGVGWHSDNSFQAEPSIASILYAKIAPPFGGDTVFANQVLAYEALSDKMKELVNGLNAVHSASIAYQTESAKKKFAKETAITYSWDDSILSEVIHPVVRVHQPSGKKALYVNEMFTLRFEGMSQSESRPILDYLTRHASRPEFCCRLKWQADGLAIWDNSLVQHYAVDDYQAYERLMYRITVKGQKPVGLR